MGQMYIFFQEKIYTLWKSLNRFKEKILKSESLSRILFVEPIFRNKKMQITYFQYIIFTE